MKWLKRNKGNGKQEELEKTLENTPAKFTAEFHAFLQYVHDESHKKHNTQQDVRRKMSEAVNKLSELTYSTYFPQIVQIVQRSKDKCANFRNTQEQVDNILSWLPRLQDHKELLTLYIEERRKKYKLEV